MLKDLKAERGQALILVVYVVVILSTLLVAVTVLVGNSKKAAFRQHDSMQAAYIADAGIEKALARLKYDQKWKETEAISSTYAGGYLKEPSIKEIPPGYLQIISTGSFGSAQKTLKAVVEIKPAPVFETYRNIISDHSDSEGNITGDLTLTPVRIIEAEQEMFKLWADNYGPGHYFTGNVDFGVADLEGISGFYYVDGNVSVGGSYSGRATIAASGKIDITSSLTTEDYSHNSLALISYQNINVIAAPTEILIDAVLWSNGRLNIYGPSKISGAAVFSELKLYGTVLNFEYKGDLLKQNPPCLPVDLKIISWQELYPIF